MHDDLLDQLRVNVELAVVALINQYVERGYSSKQALLLAEDRLYQIAWLGDQLSDLPECEADGFLPALHSCSISTIRQRFGIGSERRQHLMFRLEEILDVVGTLTFCRIMLGGSFITQKVMPRDLDVALLVGGADLQRPEVQRWIIGVDTEVQVFVERTESGWWDWFRHFGRPKPPCDRYIGVVEVQF